MSSLKNQQQEKYFFEKFIAKYPISTSNIIYTDKPDVIIEGSKKIGVEIANLYIKDGSDPSSEQRQHDLRNLVLQNAQKQHLLEGGENIELTVSFKPDYPINDRKLLEKELSLLTLKLKGFKTGEISRKNFKHLPEIFSIYYNSNQYDDAKWQAMQIYTGKSLCIERIFEIEKIKSQKIKDYQLCDSYWLLLVVNFWNPAQDQDIHIPEDFPSQPIYSSFEKIIIYKTAEESYIEIPVSNIEF